MTTECRRTDYSGFVGLNVVMNSVLISLSPSIVSWQSLQRRNGGSYYTETVVVAAASVNAVVKGIVREEPAMCVPFSDGLMKRPTERRVPSLALIYGSVF